MQNKENHMPFNYFLLFAQWLIFFISIQLNLNSRQKLTGSIILGVTCFLNKVILYRKIKLDTFNQDVDNVFISLVGIRIFTKRHNNMNKQIHELAKITQNLQNLSQGCR